MTLYVLLNHVHRSMARAMLVLGASSWVNDDPGLPSRAELYGVQYSPVSVRSTLTDVKVARWR